MHNNALPLLACPECKGKLRLINAKKQGKRIIEGVLVCVCKRKFPIINSVPRLLPDSLFSIVEKRFPSECRQLGVNRGQIIRETEKFKTQEAFGVSWHNFPSFFQEYEKQFLDWIQPVQPGFFKNKTILDAGCGKGRHVYFSAKYNAKNVIGLDLSDAVDIAAKNNEQFDNVTIVQGDILNPPLQNKFDYIYSIGVLHHLPSPRDGFASLNKLLLPKGAFSAWIYGKERNALLPFFDFLRKVFFHRFPHDVNLLLAEAGSAIVTFSLKTVYRTKFAKHLPQYDFMKYLGRLNKTIRTNIIFDQMVAPTAYYLPRSEIENWYNAAGMKNIKLVWRNKNSWVGFGTSRP